MKANRMEALTDGVVAIIITIMVLEMKVPSGAGLEDLKRSLPLLLAYALSYVNVAIYWNNHHHMLHAAEHVDGRVLWANLLMLFWLSLAPFVIRWMDDTGFAALPTAAYGFVFGMAAVGYNLTQAMIIRVNGRQSRVAAAVGTDRKGKLSLALYIAAIPLAFAAPWTSIAIYVGIAALWFAPDRRFEKVLEARRD